MQLPDIGDRLRETAKHNFEQEEKGRTAKETVAHEDWVRKLRIHDENEKIRLQLIREQPKERVDDYVKRLTAAKTFWETRAAETADQYQRAELEGKAAKLGLEIKQLAQQTSKAELHQVGDDWYERPVGSPPGTPFAKVTGIPPGTKLTEPQEKTVIQFQSGLMASMEMGTTDASLRNLQAHYLTKLAPTIGNYHVPQQFREAKSLGDSIVLAIARKDSGAAITRDEIPLYWSIYMPVPGDTQRDVERKRRLRDERFHTLYDAMGDRQNVMQDFLRRRHEQYSSMPDFIGTDEEIRRLPPGRYFISNGQRFQMKPWRSP